MLSEIKTNPALLKVFLAGFCLISGLYAMYLFFSLGANPVSIDGIIPFYPLLFLPLFIKRTEDNPGPAVYTGIAFFSLALIASMMTGLLSGVWIAFIWISLS